MKQKKDSGAVPSFLLFILAHCTPQGARLATSSPTKPASPTMPTPVYLHVYDLSGVCVWWECGRRVKGLRRQGGRRRRKRSPAANHPPPFHLLPGNGTLAVPRPAGPPAGWHLAHRHRRRGHGVLLRAGHLVGARGEDALRHAGTGVRALPERAPTPRPARALQSESPSRSRPTKTLPSPPFLFFRSSMWATPTWTRPACPP